MKRKHTSLILAVAANLVFAGCGGGKSDPAAEAPPPAQVITEQDGSTIHLDHPEQFPLATATAHNSRSELDVVGVVSPDISRNVPVISLASGRVVDIRARLGDTVKKGDLLLTVRSDDVSSAYSDYQKAVADEALARAQYDRAKDLQTHGAISVNDLQIAQDAENKAAVDVQTAAEHLRLIGNDPNAPSGVVDIYAPVSGVITDQEVTNAAGVQALGANPFTISDLSSVWIVCDVHENDLPNVHLGDAAQIRINAYPTQVFRGTVSNIGAILDPTLRTAKVRIEVRNPGLMRVGMFATATFQSQKQETQVQIPATAILHLHDVDSVFVAKGGGTFVRTEITAGASLPGNMQEVISGIAPRTQVIKDALVLQNASDQ